MTDLQFYAFWGACLGFMILFSAFIGFLEITQKKKDRQQEIEANKRRRAYEKEQAEKRCLNDYEAELKKIYENNLGNR